jgi:sorbose reductase
MTLYQPPDVHAPVLSQFSLKGKIAALTGGVRGIDLQVLRELAKAGADVAIIYTSSTNTAQPRKWPRIPEFEYKPISQT